MATSVLGATTSFNAMSYGAVGSGRAYDSQAFVKAWKAVFISAIYSGMVVAPRKTEWAGNQLHAWLIFANMNGLIVSGKGTINGQVSNLRVIAPGTSPNTDGIEVSSSTNVQIQNSFIGTGDDCIAISAGSSNINISGITYAPGHGISIGALGHGGYDVVENEHVRNCSLRNTLTGVRVKTWQRGKGYARKIAFEGIKFVDVHHPVQIDQYYCPSRVNCQNFLPSIA
ncbi:probable polygalacturonase At3g15720 [Olea europaea var. sylvestris]|uniref:probable polygalacturonase At3g15720 n=1 Tax=Olea europaea var. sylvestris TaxID=158386 RepID=UPI000C1CDB13|nr:probable polygalacturonase At3g15720 [Olea europaea var. sylvestris]